MEFYEYDTRIAVYGVVVDSERILLTWFRGNARNRACWSLPGGGLEYGESLEDALHREMHEETGLMVELGPILGSHTFTAPEGPRPPRPYMSVRTFYEARVLDGVLGTIEVDGTTARAEWVDLAQVPDVVHADIVDLGLAGWRRHHA